MGEEWNKNENEEELNEQDYAFQTLNRNGKPKSLGWSVVSLVMGAAAVFTCTFGWASIIFGVFSILFAIMSRRILGYFDGKTIAGLILGLFGIVFATAMIIFVYTIGEEDQKYIWDILKQMYEQNGTGVGGGSVK